MCVHAYACASMWTFTQSVYSCGPIQTIFLSPDIENAFYLCFQTFPGSLKKKKINSAKDTIGGVVLVDTNYLSSLHPFGNIIDKN